MRKLAVFVVAVFTVMGFVGIAIADQNNYGCGLGSMMFKDKDGLMSQTCAATFNGLCANQLFGITSGTLNCEKPMSLASNKKLNTYVADNMDNLAKDIAQGNGEYLDTLAVLMEVPEGERGNFYSRLQTNFSHIYTSENITHVDVLNNIETVISSS
jgi:hypothetical protein